MTVICGRVLTAIIRPNDVTSSTLPYGTPAVQFTYEQSQTSPFFGWCKTQILGGTNPAGSAGGTITYTYEVDDYSTPITASNALTIGRLKTTVVNRMGFVTEYATNQNGHVIKVTDKDGTTPYTTTNEYNAEGELVKITQPRGNYTEITYSTGIRLVAGNISTIKHYPGSIQSDQTLRTMSLEYEPIFNNLRLETDYRGNVTEYFTDYQEGRNRQGEWDDVIEPIRIELLEIYTRSSIESLLATIPLLDQDLNGDGLQPIAKGNVVQTRHPDCTINPVGGAPLADLELGDPIQQSVLTRTYDSYGQVTSETDEEENVSVYLYYSELNPDGDAIPTQPGTGLTTTTGGYLKRVVEDTTLPYPDPQLAGVNVRGHYTDIGRDSATNPTPVNKITDYRYDPSGNVVAITDPRGVKYEYKVNELDEVWEYKRATDVSAAATRGGGVGGTNEDLTGQAFSFDELWKFDSNGNVVAHFVQNASGWPDAIAVAGAPSNHFEEYWTYDILDSTRTATSEYGFAGETATWTYGYDANENRTALTYPEGNVLASTWDFRDRVKSITRGAGTADASQVVYSYDGNGNSLQETDGRGKNTNFDYDGFDRVKSVVQPAGTEKKLTYDPQSSVVLKAMWGHAGGPSPSGNETTQNIKLQEFAYAYDERNRLVQFDRQDPQTPLTDGTLTPSDGKVTTAFNHDRLNRTIHVVDDDTSKTERLYDGVSRMMKETDPVGNIVERGYDDNDNLIKVIGRDIYPNGTFRAFETFHVVDSLNRVASTTDNIGRTNRYTYDSRDNLVSQSDPLGSLSSQYINGRQINNPGNTTTIKVDGFGRVVLEESDLRVGGTGDGAIDAPTYNPDGRSTRTFTYDKNSRLRFATDDNGNTTEYGYDALDRLTTIVYADGTALTQSYDANDNVFAWQDARQSPLYYTYNTYDDKNRLTAVDATIPASVVGTSKLRYEYDGLDRKTKSTDSVDSVLGDGNDWVNEYTWDALNRVKTQRQNGRIVSTSWREEAKKTSIGYTSGVTVQYAFDALERATTVTQGVQLAAYSYAGKGRLLQRSDYSGVDQRYHTGPGTTQPTTMVLDAQ